MLPTKHTRSQYCETGHVHYLDGLAATMLWSILGEAVRWILPFCAAGVQIEGNAYTKGKQQDANGDSNPH